MGCASAARARNAACTGADPEAPCRPPAPHRWRLDDRGAAGCGFCRHGNRGSRAIHSAVRDGAVRVIGPHRGNDCRSADHCGREGCVGAGLCRRQSHPGKRGDTQLSAHLGVRRFACWGIFGYALAAATWWLGVPGGIYALLLKISALVLSILGIVFVLQNRAVVARWIEGSDPATAAGLSRLRYRLGETWHVLAIAYIGAIYLAYALRVEGGSGFILRATLVSLVVIVGARLFARFMEELSARGFAIAPELRAR